MHSLIQTVAFAACVLPFASTAVAGGWTQQPGDYYVKAWGRTLIGTGAFSSQSIGTAVVLDETYQIHSLNVYGEVGVTDGLTWVGYVAPVGFAAYGSNGAAHVGPAWMGARYRLLSSRSMVLSAQATAGGRVPVGDQRLFDEQVDGESVVVRGTLGTGQVDAELQFGVGFNKGWFALNAGIRGHTNAAFATAVTGYAQVGWQPNKRWVFDFHVPVQQSLRTFTELDVFGIANTRFVGFGLTGSYWFTERFAVTGSFEGATLASSNAGTPALNLGVEIR